ncbi:MAG: bifunctional glycosyltransferase family 2/GtrA family protein [Candidatus Gastranaerophilales bacterium]|nr:bifunctional glycosyltransferase family 2/GtrA family protein [Candidatus Gastranaerophilales bacterium]
MQTLSLVIPVYNEEKSLNDIVGQTSELQEDLENIKLEIIIVDDCSTDNSYKIAKSLEGENIKVFRHFKNQGKGASLKTGFLHATGDFIGVQDADMEYNPKDYLKLLKPLLENKADVCYGSRYLLRDERRVLYFWHTFMNKCLTYLTNMYSNLDITDMETCYKLFKKDVIKSILPKLKEKQFGFEPEVTMYVAQGKYRVYECAIHYNPRTYEEGKKIKPKDGFHALYCILHYGAHMASVPMQFILYVIIGGISAVINILSFLIFIKIGLSVFISVWSAFIAASVANYLLCIALLFKHKARFSTFNEILAYILTLIIMGSIDYYCTYLLLMLSFNNFWAKAFSSLIGVIGNFLFRKYFVFGKLK